MTNMECNPDLELRLSDWPIFNSVLLRSHALFFLNTFFLITVACALGILLQPDYVFHHLLKWKFDFQR